MSYYFLVVDFINGKLVFLGILDINGGFFFDIVVFGDEVEVDLDVVVYFFYIVVFWFFWKWCEV